ncbi:MAG: transporter [Elusimicrobia bacterium RIFCSPLOWO2_01_FULL_64_13]|nr:MAG: transporter [Elusimicrobia bacterium RIFCSPLOWO2_01_FULL_64_13]
MTGFASSIEKINSWVWGPPTLVLIIGTGLILTVALRGLQFRLLWRGLYLAFVVRREKGAQGDVSHFQALMTALAATVGTGNIAGVATAIALGGPGALFWMWVTGLVGMATKYAEALLGVKYRKVEPDGSLSGGPMYYISQGLGMRRMGALYAFLASVSAFGIGNMVQSHSVADALRDSFGVPPLASGLVLAAVTGLVILGGIKSIARASCAMVPVMIVVYVLGGLGVLILKAEMILPALKMVFRDAFAGSSVAGGFGGATVMLAVRYGVARGVFSNESGLGSGAIVAAAAQTSRPAVQALVSMTQTFLDTLVVCTITGLAILVTGAWTFTGTDGRALTGAPLTSAAFSAGLPGQWGGTVVAVGLVLFAYSTLIGWAYYGEKSFAYLAGPKSVVPYRAAFCLCVCLGAVTELTNVWNLADLTNGLMALPNLLGILGLLGVIARESRDV